MALFSYVIHHDNCATIVQIMSADVYMSPDHASFHSSCRRRHSVAVSNLNQFQQLNGKRNVPNKLSQRENTNFFVESGMRWIGYFIFDLLIFSKFLIIMSNCISTYMLVFATFVCSEVDFKLLFSSWLDVIHGRYVHETVPYVDTDLLVGRSLYSFCS